MKGVAAKGSPRF